MKPLMYAAIFAAVLGMFQFGFNTGVINSPQGSIEKFINASYGERSGDGTYPTADTVTLLFSLAVSATLVGGMVGGLSAGIAADKLGRRNALLYSQSFSVVGGILMGVCKVANSYELLLIGRLVIGLSCGLFTGLVPLYITEIAPVRLRGGLGTVNQLAVTFGILISQVLGLNIVLGSEESWPILLALGALVPAGIQIVLLPFMPESPRYLVINKGRESDGLSALTALREESVDGSVKEEMEEYKATKEASSAEQQDGVSILQLLTGSEYRRPLVICVLMHLSQQLSGMVAIFYYSTSFFETAGIAADVAQYSTIGVGAIMVVMTLVTIPLMDRLGRRTLHLTGLAGIVVASILIVVASSLEQSSGAGIFLIVSTFAFVVFFSIGPGSIPWLIAGELFNQGPRPSAVAVSVLVNWLANLVVGLSFPALNDAMDQLTFLPFAIMTAVLFLLLFKMLPETKGQTTEEITSLLQNRTGSCF